MDWEDPRPVTSAAAAPPRGRLAAGGAAGAFVLLTVVFTWPQAVHPASVPDFKDAYFNIWRMAWIAHQLPIDPRHLFDTNIFYPLRNTLALSDAVLVQGILGAPLIWSGVPAVVVYNVAVLASFVLCGLGMFLLVRDLTGSPAAGVLSGIVFAFAPFRVDHYYHLEMLWAQWMPFALWMLHRTLRSGRLAHGLATGAFVALQGLSCIYYVVFFATAMVFVIPVLLVGRQAVPRRRTVAALAAGALLAALVLVPYLLPYRGARELVGDRPPSDLVVWSAGPKHFLAATPDNIVYGALTGGIGSPEKRQFVGLAAVILVIVALWPPVDRTRFAYAVALAVAIDGTFGHRGAIYSWMRDHAFVFRGLRVPARYGQLVLLAAGVLAGLGLTRVEAALRARGARFARVAVLAVVAVAGAEYLTWPRALVPLETTPGPAYRWLDAQPAGVVAEFPFPASPVDVPREGRRLYRSTFHWKPMLNGYSGYYPASFVDLWQPLATFPSEESIQLLHARRVSYLVVHERDYGRDRFTAVVAELGRRRDVETFGPFAEAGGAVMTCRLLPSMHAALEGRILHPRGSIP